MMILRFMKVNVGEYFTKWKNGARINVNGKHDETKQAYEETVEYFNTKVTEIKDQNTANIEHFIHKRKLKAIYV